jgi:Tfp pilus assembly protein PilX
MIINPNLSRQSGATLITVLILMAMLHVLAATSVSQAVINMNMAQHRYQYIQAFHAADAGIHLCMRLLESGQAPYRMWKGEEEPTYWRTLSAFEGPNPAAFYLAASWPHAARVPQCLIEKGTWLRLPHAQAYLITVRGFGEIAKAQAWVQSITILEQGRWRHTWRQVAANPF